MNKVTLEIENSFERKTVTLEEELSVGRTGAAQLIISDAGLSRVNTTFFRDGDDVLIADENSLNGTSLNGERITGRPRVLSDGDEIRIGSDTLIRVLIEEDFGSETWKRRDDFNDNRSFKASGFGGKSGSLYDGEPEKFQNQFSPQQNTNLENQTSESGKPPFTLIAGVISTFVIIFLGVAAYFIASQFEKNQAAGKNQKTQQTVVKSQTIPVRVVDPLGGEDEEDLDDLIASWEVAEEEINAATVEDVTVAADASAEETELNVTAAFLAEQQSKAFAARQGETGIRPGGLNVPKELFGDGVIKQKAKLREMNTTGYKQPLDFAELAAKRLSRELIEMPMATTSFYLDVGGSAKDSPFTAFSFQTGNTEIAPGSAKYNTLAQLAGNFAGTKYDLNNAAHRKQMRMRLLRMFNQRAKPILKELADAYHQKFNRPLRVTSLTRSMDYQIGLNATNANSFKVRGEGSLPPHTSGCAFDLARKHMTADEQNFVMAKLAEMENRGVLDALIEYGTNACFHVFIYPDGAPPRM
jgi:pSer/pThr/pTyr-binding forkhead associated (FHA) protein